MVSTGAGAALGARLLDELVGVLQRAGFLEAPMSSLFHVLLPTARAIPSGAHLVRAPPRCILPSPRGKPLGGAARFRPLPAISWYAWAMADAFDLDAMLARFQARAKAVRQRPMPPIEGPERKRFVDQARVDYMDYALIGDAEGSFDDGILTLRIDLRREGGGRGAG
jgi:hypothetical protein